MTGDLERSSAAGVETLPAPSVNPLASDPELLNNFIVEAKEHLTAIELQLLTLDQDPANAEAINAVFRGFHTIKGMAGFLDLDAIRDVSHEVETILDLARGGQLAITSEVIDAILASQDHLSQRLGELEAMLQSGRTPAGEDNQELIRTIRGVAQGATCRATPAAPAAPAVPQDARAELAGEVDRPPLPPAAPEAQAASAAVPVEPETRGLLELAIEVAQAPMQAPQSREAALPEPAEAPKTAEVPAALARSIKVDTAKLDFLVDMVGEMVIAQSMLRHDPDLSAAIKPRLARNLSQLARITDEVQRTAMSMRMIPIGQLFQKTARLVRDLSRKVSKLVDLELAGEETELDRNIVEELADPLMHMVRNAVDHGIETSEERVRLGKPAHREGPAQGGTPGRPHPDSDLRRRTRPGL